MSGGHFDYIQHRMDDCVGEIVRLYKYKQEAYSLSLDEVVALQQSARVISIASQILHDVDWFISGDTGSDTFMKCIQSSMNDLFNISKNGEIHRWTAEEVGTDLLIWPEYERSIRDYTYEDEQTP